MNILIADDFGILRQGLSLLIKGQADMKVVAEAENGERAVELAKELLPDIIIMDVTMPEMDGIRATNLICRSIPDARVIALSMHANRHFVIQILKAGAMGYVLKSYLFDELVRAIRTVMRGEHYLSPQITDVLVDDIVTDRFDTRSRTSSALTDRQLQVLRLVAEGKSTKEVARDLHISPKTADATRREVMRRLNIDSVAELIKYAIREGITTL